MAYATRITGKRSIRLAEIDPGDDGGLTEEEGEARLDALRVELRELQELMFAAEQRHPRHPARHGRLREGRHDRQRLRAADPASCRVAAFKEPTPEEEAHHFLWRADRVTPGLGELVIFDRSYYEQVILPQVYGEEPQDEIDRRLRAHHRLRAAAARHGIIVMKFFLHVSKDEQRTRLEEREGNLETAWKISARDWEARERWDEYMAAYDATIHACDARRAMVRDPGRPAMVPQPGGGRGAGAAAAAGAGALGKRARPARQGAAAGSRGRAPLSPSLELARASNVTSWHRACSEQSRRRWISGPARLHPALAQDPRATEIQRTPSPSLSSLTTPSPLDCSRAATGVPRWPGSIHTDAQPVASHCPQQPPRLPGSSGSSTSSASSDNHAGTGRTQAPFPAHGAGRPPGGDWGEGLRRQRAAQPPGHRAQGGGGARRAAVVTNSAAGGPGRGSVPMAAKMS